MTQARKLYESFGFRMLCGPMGATGHSACDTWYALDLTGARAGDGAETIAGPAPTTKKNLAPSLSH
jgi:hypothetical protein